jgi:hypothetical protein
MFNNKWGTILFCGGHSYLTSFFFICFILCGISFLLLTKNVKPLSPFVTKIQKGMQNLDWETSTSKTEMEMGSINMDLKDIIYEGGRWVEPVQMRV